MKLDEVLQILSEKQMQKADSSNLVGSPWYRVIRLQTRFGKAAGSVTQKRKVKKESNE